MGFYLRKSFKLGGFRINLSKSGIGYSAGFKGFRIGTNANGQDYIHAGRNGFYYRKYFSNHDNSFVPPESKDISVHNKENRQLLENISTDINCEETSEDEVVNSLNASYRKPAFLVIFIYIFIGFAIVDFIFQLNLFIRYSPLFFVIIIISMLCDIYRKTVTINYDLDNKEIIDSFKKMKNCQKIECISSTYKNIDTKYSSGANQTNVSSHAVLTIGLPKYVKSNINVPIINFEKNVLYFFPDRILLLKNNQFIPISYNEVWIENAPVKVVEDFAPSDAKIVDRTWKYTNKKGGPDKRFKNNYSCPICQYQHFRIKSNSGLDCLLYFSKEGCCDEFEKILDLKIRGAEDIENNDLQNGVCIGMYISGISNWKEKLIYM